MCVEKFKLDISLIKAFLYFQANQTLGSEQRSHRVIEAPLAVC